MTTTGNVTPTTPQSEPLAEVVYQAFCAPTLQQFIDANPSANHEELLAANAIIHVIGAAVIQLKRLDAGLDSATLKPGASGLLVSEFEFKPTPEDTPESRAAVARTLAAPEGDGELRRELPVLSSRDAWPGQYL